MSLLEAKCFNFTNLSQSHERGPRVNILNVVRLVFTWGSPILGGYVSQSNGEFRNQIMIINIIQAFSSYSSFVATPETNFNRSELLSEPVNQPVTFTSTTISAGSTPSASKFKSYLSTMRCTNAHSTSKFTVTAVLSPLRALSAPSTLLTFLLTAHSSPPPMASQTSSPCSSRPCPRSSSPASLGYIFILPLILGLVFYSIAAVSTYLRSRPPNHLSTSRHLSGAIGGLMIGVAGLISFGIYTVGQLSPQTFETAQQSSVLTSPGKTSVFASSAFFRTHSWRRNRTLVFRISTPTFFHFFFRRRDGKRT